MSIVLPNHLFIQVLAVFLDHIEKLLDKCIIEIFSCDLSYDQIKNLVLRRDTRIMPDWQNLPHEVLFHIFSYLNSQDLVKCCGMCKTWYTSGNDDILWKRLFLR